jgi:hypothetical protein
VAAVSNAPSPTPAGDFAGRIQEAQRQLSESVAVAGLQRDVYRFPLEALAIVIGTFPQFVTRLEATRQPFAAEDLRRLERAAATGADRRAMELARAANRRTALIGAGVLTAALLIGAGAGYWLHGAQPIVVGVRAGADKCENKPDGSRLCWIPVWERGPPQVR